MPRSSAVDNNETPDQQQSAEEYGRPNPDDESWLQDQGYPKLGKNVHERLTQVEHGPYPGGTQQGDADTESQD